MANELNIQLDPFSQTGLTLLGRVYSDSGTEQTGSPVSMSEVNTGLYSGNFTLTGIADGEYSVRFETNTPDKLYGTGAIYVRNNAEVSQENFFNATLDTVANVTLVDTTTTNTDMRGTDNALLAGSYTAPDNAGIAANGSAIAALNDLDATQVENAVWDATALSHSAVGSTGFELVLAGRIIDDTTAINTPTGTTIELASGSAVDDFYNNELIYIGSGAGAGQSRIVADYDGASKTVTVSAPFVVPPANGDRIVIQTTHTYTSDEIQAVAESAVAGDANIAAIKAKTDQLNFTGTDVQSVASNMRGTDGANTVAPDNAGISANGAAISALNDFDPVTDIVANVTTVQTTISNTDMRGSDGVPTNPLLTNDIRLDNLDATISSRSDFDESTDQVIVSTNNDKTGYSISGIKQTLDALNDISTADVKTQADQALTDYDGPTKAELDSAELNIISEIDNNATGIQEVKNNQSDMKSGINDASLGIPSSGDVPNP